MAKKKSATKKTTAKKTATKKTSAGGKKSGGKKKSGAKNSLVANINRKKKQGTSRSKKASSVSQESYDQMQKGWPKSKKKKAARKRAS